MTEEKEKLNSKNSLYEIFYFRTFLLEINGWMHQQYGHLPPIMKIIQVRRTRHTRHCWRSRDELISDVLLWTPTYGWAKAGRPARTYIQQLCEDTGCSPEDLPEAMNDREKWRERVRDIRASGTTRWWHNCHKYTIFNNFIFYFSATIFLNHIIGYQYSKYLPWRIIQALTA